MLGTKKQRIIVFSSPPSFGVKAGQHMMACAAGKGLLDFAEARVKWERSRAKAKQPVVLTGFAARSVCDNEALRGDLIFGSFYQEKEQRASAAQKR